MSDKQTLPSRRGWAVWLATGFWSGFSPFAPGTVGTLWGLPLAWLLAQTPLWLNVVLILALNLVGIPLCTRACQQLQTKDPGCVVWDEIASMTITFFLVSQTDMNRWTVLLAGFVLHRIFDISKLPPLNRLERLPAGLGVMADDWMAGVYSCVSLQLLLKSGILG
ncbi:MAG: phosphatidylglycerophosphatase A [Pirellulaceae bacterium]